MDSFASVADAVAATRKRLEKRAILAAYLRGLSPEELPVATVFLTGRPFPLSDERTLQVGGSLLRRVALQVTGATEEEYEATYISRGDSGETVAELLASGAPPSSSMTLLQAKGLYDSLARQRSASDREGLLADALRACRPPAAKYLVKIITSGMRIGVQESLVEEAVAEAFERDVETVRRANMLLGDSGRTALLAREGRLHEAELVLFRPLKFMLATAIEEPAEALRMGDEWLVEDKYDGIRAQLHCAKGEARLYSRTLDEVTAQFPEIVAAFAGREGHVVCDGEIIAQQGDRQLGFPRLSKRLGRKQPPERLLQEVPVIYVGFDLLALDGELLLEAPLAERRSRLEALARPPVLQLSELSSVTEEEPIQRAFEAAIDRANEGLVLKAPESPYRPGSRGRDWLKLKRPLATLDVAIVAAEYGHGRRRGLLSDYTFAVRDGERLVPIGKAYSGVTDQEIALLTDRFRRTAIHDFGRGVVVPPTVVIEVAFNAVNRSSRHRGGFALRFPRIKRLRLDKPVSEVDTLDRVRELWQRQGHSR